MKNKISERPILSVSMLVSGREEMKKSLTSLKPFREAFPCEVILVDTGCNQEQRAYAEEHADKVIDFKWCDDFAAARNAGLKEAKGEWFMFLDDDEWFDDPREIVAFFTSGEYKKYNSASYVIRNYTDSQGVMYEDSYASRMVRLKPDVRFVGRVHEYLDPFSNPRKGFHDFAHHYGYAYKDEAASRKHAERNIAPLLKLREEEPGNSRWVLQLAQEYSSIKEYEKTVRTCIKGLEECRRLGTSVTSGPTYFGGIYAVLVTSLDNMRKYEEGERYLKEALADPMMGVELMEPTAAFLCMAGARLCTRLGKHEESRGYFKRYMDYKRKFGDDRERIENGSAGMASEVFQERMLYGAVLICMESLICTEDEALAREAFYMPDWNDKRLLKQEIYEKSMLDACCRVPYRSLWAEIMQTLVSRKGGAAEMCLVFQQQEEEYGRNGETEKLSRLRRLVSELDCDRPYVICTKILWEKEKAEKTTEADEEKKGRGKACGFFAELFEKHGDELPHVREEVWDAAEEFGIDLEPFFLRTDFRKWRNSLEKWKAAASAEKLLEMEKRLATWKRTNDIRYGISAVKCAEGRLLRLTETETGLSEWEEALEKFSDVTLVFYRPLCRESVFRDMPEVLPDEACVAVHVKELLECRNAGDDKGALVALRQCIGVSPVLEKALETYADLLKNGIENRDKEAEKTKKELEVLVNALKATARLRMERKEYQIAKEILLQIQGCMPGDKETAELLRQVENVMRVEGGKE